MAAPSLHPSLGPGLGAPLGSPGQLHSPINTLSSPVNGMGPPFSVISSPMGPHSMSVPTTPTLGFGTSSPQVRAGPGRGWAGPHLQGACTPGGGCCCVRSVPPGSGTSEVAVAWVAARDLQRSSARHPPSAPLLQCGPSRWGGPRSRDSGLCRVRTPHSPGSPASLEPLVLSAAPLYPGLSLLRPGPVPSWSPVPGGFSGPCPDRTGGTCPGSVQTYPSWSHGGPRSPARLGVSRSVLAQALCGGFGVVCGWCLEGPGFVQF